MGQSIKSVSAKKWVAILFLALYPLLIITVVVRYYSIVRKLLDAGWVGGLKYAISPGRHLCPKNQLKWSENQYVGWYLY